MASALECPACGARHPLESVPSGATFRCDRCGQVLKVPSAVAAPRASGASAATASTSATGRAPASPASAPPPRRGGRAAAGPTVSATASQTGSGAAPVPDNEPTARSGRTSRGARSERRRVAWYWRLLAWIVAVPLGFVITAYPAVKLDLLTKDDVLDVFVGSGTGRYTQVLVAAAVWALVTALLVQLFVEGGRFLMARRRERRSASPPASTTRAAWVDQA